MIFVRKRVGVPAPPVVPDSKYSGTLENTRNVLLRAQLWLALALCFAITLNY